MKSLVFLFFLCYLCCVFGAPPTKFDKVNEEIDIKNKLYVQNLLPSSLTESIQSQKEHHQPRNGRILNSLQFVQHPTGGQSVYLPHSTNHITDVGKATTTQQNPEIVDLQVPTSANTNRVLLQLPSQQVSLHNTFIAPPRRHYRITLIRNRKPTSNPQLLTPEVEEKTLIYVLVKKPDESSTVQIEEMENTVHKNNAPEVYFIKYKDNNTSNPSPDLMPNN